MSGIFDKTTFAGVTLDRFCAPCSALIGHMLADGKIGVAGLCETCTAMVDDKASGRRLQRIEAGGVPVLQGVCETCGAVFNAHPDEEERVRAWFSAEHGHATPHPAPWRWDRSGDDDGQILVDALGVNVAIDAEEYGGALSAFLADGGPLAEVPDLERARRTLDAGGIVQILPREPKEDRAAPIAEAFAAGRVRIPRKRFDDL